MIQMILSIFTLIGAQAQVPVPTENSHPGSQTVLLEFEKTVQNSLGRKSALYLPIRVDGKKAPLIVFGHGQALSEEHYDKTLEHIAGKGIAVLFVQFDNGFFDQDWRRMADDWNKITKETIEQHSDRIHSQQIVYSGHSKGGYVGLMAAGAPSQPGVGSGVFFAPAGYDQQYLKALDKKTPVTLVWGERDSIILGDDVKNIYNKMDIDHKQFLEVKSYSFQEADHYFPQNKSTFFGGKNGIGPYHYEGVWKWLVAAAWDLEDGSPLTQEYLYGDKAVDSGNSFEHLIDRSWKVRHEYLVKLKPGLGRKQITSLLGSYSVVWKNWVKVILNKDRALSLKQRSEVEAIGLNHKLRELTTPNDLHSDQWAFYNPNGFDVRAEKAWDLSTGSHDIVVGVIDSGIKLTHSDLRDNLWINEAEVNGLKGEDDDGNGYVDDINGYNFASNQASPDDSRGHGTMVSGMIGAVGNNNRGLTGMAWNVRLMALNMFPNLWGDATLESALKALEYAIEKEVSIINASWGQADDDLEPDEGFLILKEAIELAEQKGILFVAAAGNSYGDNDKKGMIPATLAVDNILSVGAMNAKGEKWSKTNFGKTSVEVFAPGEDILTTHPSGTRRPSGTSLSAPIVSGIAVLMLDVNPDLGPSEIIQIMMESCDSSSHLVDLSRCGGTINAATAVQKAKEFVKQ